MAKATFCSHCGFQNEDDDIYCANCGKKLSAPIEIMNTSVILRCIVVIAVILTGAYFLTNGNIDFFLKPEQTTPPVVTPTPVQKTTPPVVTPTPVQKTTPPVVPPTSVPNTPYNIGIPNLNGKTYYENDMNVAVLWVHYQLKATGKYYQGDNWDETGNLGDTTMNEIAKFMKAHGYPNHNGRVDQTVINTLANYLGNRVVPVYVGGYYEHMNTIMSGGSAGSMQSIDENSNSRKIKWVQACLKKLGYYTGSIDGKFGSGTINALNRFQEKSGYVQRDYVSLGVARKMLEACYARGYSLDDLP